MNNTPPTYIYLPGAGNSGEGELAAFSRGLNDVAHFELVPYPGWRRYVAGGYSAEFQLEALITQIEKLVPAGPIRIVGLSIGGHFGYAAALRLAARGREVAELCVIDSFMITSSKPRAGWKSRAAGQGLEFLREMRFAQLIWFVRSKLWRALIRLEGGRSIKLYQVLSKNFVFNALLRIDHVGETELDFRLLTRAVMPWLSHLDDAPEPLMTPTMLLRTSSNTDDDLGWKRRCPRITVVDIPGGHDSLFEPENVAVLRSAFLSTSSLSSS